MSSSLTEKFAKISENVLIEFSRVTGTDDLLSYMDDVTVKTQDFEAVASARLTYRIDKKPIESPPLALRESNVDQVLKDHFLGIDERHEWLEHHLGLSHTFENHRQCSCEYSETCGSCAGEGKTDCKSCSGNGEVSCNYYKCKYGKVECTGYGISDCRGGYAKCVGCGGSGCNQCGGSGRGFRCISCNGSGKNDCPSCHGTTRISCSACRATGKTDCLSCRARGYTAHRKTLTAFVETDLSYVGDTSEVIKRLRGISKGFSQQLTEVPKRNLRLGSSGKKGQYSFKGDATYSYIRPTDGLMVFVGHSGYQPQVSQELYKPVTERFRKLIDTLDIDALEKTAFGKEVLRYMCGDTPARDSYLVLYDKAGTLRDSVDKIMPGVDRKILQGEWALWLKYVSLCGVSAFLVYLLPFQDALDATGIGDLFYEMTSVSPWFWGAFVTLWGMPVLAVKLLNRARRNRRKIRSEKILGSSRKMKKEGGAFATWLAAMTLQAAILAGTSFLPAPFFPKPCNMSEMDLGKCLALSVGAPFLGGPMTLMTYGIDKSKPQLDEIYDIMTELRNTGQY